VTGPRRATPEPPLRVRVAYGASDLGASLTFVAVNTWLLYVLVNVAGIPPAWAGVVFVVGRLVDAVTDPVMGVLADRWRDRFGRLPFVRWGALPLAVTFAAVWWAPALGPTAAVAYAIVSFVGFMYVVPWIARHSSTPTSEALIANMFGLMAICVAALSGGWMGDQIGHRRTAMIGLVVLVTVAWPAFQLMLSGNFVLMALGSMLLGIGQGLFIGAFSAMMVTLLPRRVRVTGMAFSYSLATGALGGLAPLLCEYLVDRAGFLMAPALVIAVSAALSLAVIALHPLWRHNDESLPEDHASGVSSRRSHPDGSPGGLVQERSSI
jgi:MFS family permease